LQQQLHRLRDAAYETHMSFLAEWFPSETNTAVTHESGSKSEPETLSIDLRALSMRPRMTRDLDAFTACLSEWKHYQDDQLYPGDYAIAVPG
jgi:hypothetical protein